MKKGDVLSISREIFIKDLSDHVVTRTKIFDGFRKSLLIFSAGAYAFAAGFGTWSLMLTH